MKRWITTLIIIGALTLGLAQVVEADVTGQFNIDLTLNPQTNAQEAVPFFFDLQSNLIVNITVSGMTFAMDIGFGTTGLEFAIVSVGTNLGALAIRDEFIFASPFGCSMPTWLGVVATMSDNTDGGIADQCLGLFVTPIGSSNGATNDASIGFVGKRVDMQLDIAGISLAILALFEDVDFPDIHGAKDVDSIGAADGSDHEHDHFLTTDLYFTGVSDTVLDNQTPSFGFGGIFTITGQTVSGIRVTNIVGLCADNEVKTRIKKRKFMGAVNAGCIGAAGPMFTFDVERLHIEGIELGGINLSKWVEFRPLLPMEAQLDVSFSLAGVADVKGSFHSNDISTIMIDTITVSIASGNFSLTLEDINADLSFDIATSRTSLILNPNQNPASFASTTVAEMAVGITSQTLELSVTRMGLTIAISTAFVQDASGGLSWDNAAFDLSAKLNVVTFGSNVIFTNAGLQVGTLNVSVEF